MSVQIIVSGETAEEALLKIAALANGLKTGHVDPVLAQPSVTEPAPVQLYAVPQPVQYAQPQPVNQQPVNQQPVNQQPVNLQPTFPADVPAAVPTQQAHVQQPPAAVPTSTQAYDLQQLAVAATALMEAGTDITAILAQFGVQALTQLPKERYGEFATVIRGLGARI